MAYNGGIKFTPDIYYEIKEDNGDITVLRNGDEISGGGGVDMPKFTVTLNPDETVESIVCDKTFEQCMSYIESNMICSALIEVLNEDSLLFIIKYSDGTENYIDYNPLEGSLPFYGIRYNSDGTIITRELL